MAPLLVRQAGRRYHLGRSVGELVVLPDPLKMNGWHLLGSTYSGSGDGDEKCLAPTPAPTPGGTYSGGGALLAGAPPHLIRKPPR